MIKISNAFGMLKRAAKERREGNVKAAREALTYARYWRLHPSTKVWAGDRTLPQDQWKANERRFRLWLKEL